MKRVRLGLASAALAATLVISEGAGAKTIVRHTLPTERLSQTIVVIVNGTRLSLAEAPRLIDGRLWLPLRPILSALGIPLEPINGKLTASLPTGQFSIRPDGSEATLDGQAIGGGGAKLVDRNGVTYVPYPLLQRAFAGALTYNQRAATVEVVSPYFVGAPPTGGSAVTGNVAAVDRNSRPQQLTVVSGGNPRTIALTSSAKIWLEDVSVRTQVPSSLGDVNVGDVVHVILAKNGSVLSMHDFFKSLSSTIAAVSPNAIALADGRVVVPQKWTRISLNGAPVGLSELAVEDFVTIRNNPETGDLRQIVGTRQISATPGSNSAVRITAFGISATRPLHAGETLVVDLNGSSGGKASFDIGDYLTGVPLREERSGAYHGTFVVPQRFNLGDVPIYGHLVVGGVAAPRAQSDRRLTTLTTPPLIDDFAPRPQTTVDDRRPTVYATFSTPTQGAIDQQSVRLEIDGHDVTSEATRSSTYVIYMPTHDLALGPRTVTLRLRDAAGNVTVKSWSFTIAAR